MASSPRPSNLAETIAYFARSSPAQMVKRSLTRIGYPRGLGARFPSLYGDRARPFSANSRPRAALDTLEPPPTTVLLSAEEAK
jgi:hypothetical protein